MLLSQQSAGWSQWVMAQDRMPLICRIGGGARDTLCSDSCNRPYRAARPESCSSPNRPVVAATNPATIQPDIEKDGASAAVSLGRGSPRWRCPCSIPMHHVREGTVSTDPGPS